VWLVTRIDLTLLHSNTAQLLCAVTTLLQTGVRGREGEGSG